MRSTLTLNRFLLLASLIAVAFSSQRLTKISEDLEKMRSEDVEREELKARIKREVKEKARKREKALRDELEKYKRKYSKANELLTKQAAVTEDLIGENETLKAQVASLEEQVRSEATMRCEYSRDMAPTPQTHRRGLPKVPYVRSLTNSSTVSCSSLRSSPSLSRLRWRGSRGEGRGRRAARMAHP